MNQVPEERPRRRGFWRRRGKSVRSPEEAAATSERLDSVAKVLAGATAAAAGLLTTFGANRGVLPQIRQA